MGMFVTTLPTLGEQELNNDVAVSLLPSSEEHVFPRA